MNTIKPHSAAETDGFEMPYVTEINDELVLVDPQACEVIKAINEENCRKTYDLNLDRINYFKQRFIDRQDNPEDVCIVIINVDDSYGKEISDILMPNVNWQEYRDRNEVPFVRGLASKPFVVAYIDECIMNSNVAKTLNDMQTLAVVVIDWQNVEIFE